MSATKKLKIKIEENTTTTPGFAVTVNRTRFNVQVAKNGTYRVSRVRRGRNCPLYYATHYYPDAFAPVLSREALAEMLYKLWYGYRDLWQKCTEEDPVDYYLNWYEDCKELVKVCSERYNKETGMVEIEIKVRGREFVQ